MSPNNRVVGAWPLCTGHAVAIILATGFIVGCSGEALELSDGERVESFADPLKGSYVELDEHTYVSVLAVQAGWRGWKERHLSRDGLLGVQLVLRCPPVEAPRTFSVPEECQGFLFLASSSPIGSWSVSRGTVTIEREAKRLEISGQLQLGESNRAADSQRTQSKSASRLAIRKASLAQNADTLREIRAKGNLETVPELRVWASEIAVRGE